MKPINFTIRGRSGLIMIWQRGLRFLKFETLKCHFLHSEHYVYLLNLPAQYLYFAYSKVKGFNIISSILVFTTQIWNTRVFFKGVLDITRGGGRCTPRCTPLVDLPLGTINLNQNSDSLQKNKVDGNCVLFSHQWFIFSH